MLSYPRKRKDEGNWSDLIWLEESTTQVGYIFS